MMLLKDFGHRVRKLQRWWRKCQQRLHEQRQMVSKRWRVIERQELQKEYPTFPERIEDETIRESVRHEFIENELRARRYLVLPQIELWEADIIRWKKSMEEWAETRAAHRWMGSGGVLDQASMAKQYTAVFSWPEARPSHLPPKHPNHQHRSCPEDCPGRRGDEEIRHMVQRCREANRDGSIGGWRTLSKKDYHANSSGKKKKKKATSGKKVVVASPLEEQDLQPTNPPDTELQRFGVHMATLPCLSGTAPQDPLP